VGAIELLKLRDATEILNISLKLRLP